MTVTPLVFIEAGTVGSIVRKYPSKVTFSPGDDLCYVYNLMQLRGLVGQWRRLLPEVQPFYAVKCNPDKRVLNTLAASDVHFDCASPTEIGQVLSLGIHPSRILYANPCKRESDLRFMVMNGVTRTTFDSVCELEKIARICPQVECILRIYANDPSAQCILSNKFGAFEEEWEELLQKAMDLHVRVVGVSFHVGSGACNPEVFEDAIQKARALTDLAKTFGFAFHTVDIGGGFSVTNIECMARSIQKTLAQHFPPELGVQCIAEPGRYFAETIATLYTKIIGVRERRGLRDYFITDSLYGSFNCILYDHITPLPEPFDPTTGQSGVTSMVTEDVPVSVPSCIFGPTCDGFDKIVESVPLPRLEYGDWLQWADMGAYTIAGACDFNGIRLTQPKCIYLDG